MVLLLGPVFAVITAIMAYRKNRNPWLWGIAGLLLFFLAMIVLAFMPYICPKCKKDLSLEDGKKGRCPVCGDIKLGVVFMSKNAFSLSWMCLAGVLAGSSEAVVWYVNNGRIIDLNDMDLATRFYFFFHEPGLLLTQWLGLRFESALKYPIIYTFGAFQFFLIYFGIIVAFKRIKARLDAKNPLSPTS